MTSSPISDAERNLLAAEYALGLLDPAEHARAAWLYRTDPAFADEADRWTEEGAGWIEETEAEAPSEESYQRIAASLGLNEGPEHGVPEHEAHEPREQHEPQVRLQPVVTSTPGAWRPFAIAASLAAVTFAGLWLFDRPSAPEQTTTVPEPTTASYASENLSIAQINSEDATSLVSALYDGDTGTLYIRLTDIPDPERVPQLWLLDSAGQPRSLGFGTRDANAEIVLSPEQRQIARDGGTLAISLEQPASVPHATPSDVLGAAQLARLDIEP